MITTRHGRIAGRAIGAYPIAKDILLAYKFAIRRGFGWKLRVQLHAMNFSPRTPTASSQLVIALMQRV